MSEAGQYVLPNPIEEKESDRLDLQHRIWITEHNGSLCRSETSFTETFPTRVLDICSGSGSWTIPFAQKYPNVRVTGADINPPPPLETHPDNVKFAKGDAEGNWSSFTSSPATQAHKEEEEQDKYDLIYGRMLVNSIRNWPSFFQKCYSHLHPDSILEINDVIHNFNAFDASANENNSALMKWWNVVFKSGSRKNGIEIDAVQKHAARMREAGFLDVREEVVKWFVGSRRVESAGGGEVEWREMVLGSFRRGEKDDIIGGMWLRDLEGLVPGVTGMVVNQGGLPEGMNEEDVWRLASEAVEDGKRNGVERGYNVEFVIVTGRKS